MSQSAQPPDRHAHDAVQASKPPYVLAIDVGTSSVRTLFFDAAGRAVPKAQAQLPYALSTSGEGEACVDADELVKLVERCIDDALKAAGPLASQVAAVATDTFWHSLVAVDAEGKALTPVLTWEDNRSRHALSALAQQLDPQAVHRRTGARLHTSYWPAKLRWLAESLPDVFAKTAQWLSFGEYLHRRFLGKSVCSLSMASATGMLDIRRRAWDAELQRATGTRPEQFPPLGDLDESITGLAPDYTARWPALRKTPWFPAIGDGAAANVGSGCIMSNRLALTIGTTSALRMIVSPDDVEPTDGLWLYLLDARRALLGGALSEGGDVPAWLESTMKLPPLAEAEQHIAAIAPATHGLTVLPFITGERSPGWHAHATMAMLGLTIHTTPFDILRASLEAIAYQLLAVYTELLQASKSGGQTTNTPRLIGSGGALLSSPTLQRILASTLDTPLYPSLEREASARGVALLALEALKIIPDAGKVPVELSAPIPPDKDEHEVYMKAAERQQRWYNIAVEEE
jgi:gluconokinase